ncbi:hypothetical protein J1N35_012283 [Gossypium stocksii]|uniref:Myb/SANT-like domain-containing protein n=1 Tax=Gossypium stocksii TaxID=47602 RepID=A0A9D3W5V0_9ROSI|nr:hypothetical protein J1N35_012283 [Gossypium stocksii]
MPCRFTLFKNGYPCQEQFGSIKDEWTPEMDRYFIDLMLEQLNKRIAFYDYVFSKTAWMNMNSSFNERFKFEYEMDVLKNWHKVLRNLYKAVKNLLNQKGFKWDSTRQMVNPDVRPYRVKTIPYYDDLGIVYGDNSARKKGNDSSLILLGLKFGGPLWVSGLNMNMSGLRTSSHDFVLSFFMNDLCVYLWR